MAGRLSNHAAGVEGARPYGVNGNMPADAVVTAYKPHGRGVPFLSDRPYELPYADRPTCQGTKTNSEPCKAKARPAMRCCEAHASQE